MEVFDTSEKTRPERIVGTNGVTPLPHRRELLASPADGPRTSSRRPLTRLEHRIWAGLDRGSASTRRLLVPSLILGTLLLLVMSALACAKEPERGPKLAAFAIELAGEEVGSSSLYAAKADPSTVIEETKMYDDGGRLLTSTQGTLTSSEPMRFEGRIRSNGSIDAYDVEALPDQIEWRKRRGLEISRSTTENGDLDVLAWSLLSMRGDPGSMALWSRFAEGLDRRSRDGMDPAAATPAGRRFRAFNILHGRSFDLFVSHRETRALEVDGVARPVHRLFVSTNASGHTLWIDAESGHLLSLSDGFDLEISRRGFSPPERPIEPLPESLIAEELTLERDDVKLSGTLTLPAGSDGPLPLVVLIHGSGEVDRDQSPFHVFRHLAHDLGEEGFAVLRYDKRGVGESRFRSEERDLTIDALAGDVIAWLDLMVTRPEIDPERVALAGHSEGGYIGPWVASRDERVSSVIMLAAPVDPLPRILREQALLVFDAHGLTETEIDELVSKQEAMLRRVESSTELPQENHEELAWLRSHARHDSAAVLRRVDVPILAIFAAEDIQVPIGQAERLEEIAEEKMPGMIEIEILDGVDHVLMDDRGRRGLGLFHDPDRRLDERVPRTMATWLR